MSDFLSQFDKENYNKKTTEKTKKEEKKEINSSEDLEESYIEQESIEDVDNAIKSTEHDTEIDLKYHKRKVIRYVVIASTIVLVSMIIFLAIYLLNRVTVKNFVGQNISEAKTWGLKNDIEIDVESVYSIEQDENIVISQNKEPDSKIQKGSVIFLKVSKGADPEEILELPNFSEMLQAEIKEWIDKNKAYNINVTGEYSEEIEKNHFIKMEFKDSEVTETNYKRKDSLTVYVSKGSEKNEKNITVPDFKGKAKSEVETWAKTNSIVVKYEESGSEEIETGMVISQDVEAGTKISRSDTVTVTISVGKGVTVPNFSNLSKEEAASADPNLVVTVRSMYSETVPYGRLISQSVKTGTKLYGDNKRVEVIYSEGRPYIENLVGRYENDLAPYFYNYTLKGANITYTIDHVDSHLEKGMIVWTSRVNEYIEMSTNIHVYISKGNFPPPSDVNTNSEDNTANNDVDTNTALSP